MASGSVTEASDPETFLAVLGETVATLDAWGGPFLVFGSIAIHVYVEHPAAEDVDVLFRNEDIDAAVAAAIAESGATSAKDLGKVMKAVMPKLAGKNADGRAINEAVRKKLSA
ncbi:MAG: GatB/YqeY domain-containing protein [Actinomycetota bacterium]|nr:GatB/YqeY domain-containing protein [Actinomycetota bacterium]